MRNKIEILSPGPGCRRTQRIINALKSFLQNNNIDFEMEIINNQQLFSNYKTWILPTVIVNNKIVSRGYQPGEQKIREHLIQ